MFIMYIWNSVKNGGQDQVSLAWSRTDPERNTENTTKKYRKKKLLRKNDGHQRTKSSDLK